MEPSLTVLICTRDRAESLAVVLDDLAAGNLHDDVELVVVDNASPDNTREVVERFAALHPGQVRLVREPRPGKPYALNTGIRAGRGAAIAFTDDDVRIPGDWVEQIKRALAEHPEAGVFGGRVEPILPEGRTLPAWVRRSEPNVAAAPLVDHRRGPAVRSYLEPDMQFPVGANMVVRREVFEAHGLFDEYDERFGCVVPCEDAVLGARLKRAGVEMLHIPDLRVGHVTPPERLTKAYFRIYSRRMAFTNVMGMARNGEITGPLVVHVPRHLFVKLFQAALHYLAGLAARVPQDDLFARELKLVFFLALVREFYKLGRRDAARARAEGQGN